MLRPMLLAPIVIQAEQGALGSDFATADDGQGTQYVTITGTMGGDSPALAARVISFEVEFPAPGSYELYLRAFVGPGGANDDSFFCGNGFGSKDPAADGDWIIANNLNAAGYNAPEDLGADAGP
jgi:endo-1,4-beta-xylanase